jgi:hypothetical protein
VPDVKNTSESTAIEPQNVVSGSNSGGPVLDFDEVFNAYMAGNQKAWAHDRGSTVGASEVWDCLRKVFYEKRAAELGFQPDEKDASWGAMERGNLIENHFVVPALRLALPKMPSLPDGIELLLAGGDQKTLVLGKNSATPDGVIRGLTPGPLTIRGGKQDIFIPDIKSDCIIVEIKSIDPRATLLEERAKHHGQTQVQLGLIREMTEFKPYYSVVLYIDASFIDHVTPFVVEYDEKQYAVAKERAAAVYAHTDPMMFMPEGRFTGACEHCRWRTACGSSVIAAIPPKNAKLARPEAVAETDPLIRDYFAARAAYKEAERRLEITKEHIKEALLDNNVRSMAGDGWKATWFSVAGKKKLNTEKMEADGIDLSKYEEEGAPHDQLRITEHLPDKPKKSTV